MSFFVVSWREDGVAEISAVTDSCCLYSGGRRLVEWLCELPAFEDGSIVLGYDGCRGQIGSIRICLAIYSRD